MKECETCLVKAICDVCGKRLCSTYQMCDETAQKMRKIAGHYHIDNKIICVECHDKKNDMENPCFSVTTHGVSI